MIQDKDLRCEENGVTSRTDILGIEIFYHFSDTIGLLQITLLVLHCVHLVSSDKKYLTHLYVGNVCELKLSSNAS